jgi:tellurite resistance protein
MSNRSHYSAAEWRLLADAPLAAAAAVALADAGGGEREAAAMITGWRAAAVAFADSELIRDLVATMDPQDRADHERPAAQRPAGPDAIRDEAVELCMQAVELLAQRTAPAEQEAYKAFVLQIAEQVAEAASESGPFNFTNRISRDERSALREIAAALRLR